jgi:PAS domain-containing protein
MSLRGKFAAVFLVLLLVPIVTATVLEIDRTMEVMVDGLGDAATLLLAQAFEQMRAIPNLANTDIAAAVRGDRAMRAFIESSEAFGKGVVYVRVEKLDGTILLGAGTGASHPARIAPPFEKLQSIAAGRWPLSKIYALWTPRTYELSRAVEAGGKPLALIAVGLSTSLIAPEVHRALARILIAAAVAVALGLLGGAIFGGLVLQPLAAITSGVEEMAVGREDVRVEVGGTGELSVLAEKFNQLSQRIRLNQAQWEAERGRLLKLFRSISDALLLLDPDGAILFANEEAQGRLGLPAGGLANGKSLETLLGAPNALVRIVNTALNALTGLNDVPIEMGDGAGRVHFLVSIFVIGQSPAGPGLLVILRDLEPVRELRAVRDEIGRLDKAVEALSPLVETPARESSGGRSG